MLDDLGAVIISFKYPLWHQDCTGKITIEENSHSNATSSATINYDMIVSMILSLFTSYLPSFYLETTTVPFSSHHNNTMNDNKHKIKLY